MRSLARANASLGLALLVLLFGALQRSEADATVGLPPAADLPSNQDLDKLLAARDWNALGRELSTGASLQRGMDWLRSRIDSGGGLMLSILYARDLWVVAKAQKVADLQRQMRTDAAMISLYAFELIAIDGEKCADRTAPSHRLDQLLAARHETLAFLAAETKAIKSAVIERAIGLEQRTAAIRPDDDLICRDGVEQYRASIEHGQQQELPAAPGQGKTVVVTPPAGWTPKLLPAEAYRPAQDKARARMRDTLTALLR